MGFFSKLLGATVATALTPVGVVVDVAKVVTGNEPSTTEALAEKVTNNLSEALEDLGDGEL